jgi:hypothetical protein
MALLTALTWVLIAVFIISIIAVSASSYGMGIERGDMCGIKGKVAASFLIIGITILLVSTILLINYL